MFAVSGGLVASFALPASAANSTTDAKTSAPAVAESFKAFSAAPAPRIASGVTEAKAAAAAASVAPSAAPAPRVTRTFGKIGFKGVVKQRAVPAPVVERTIAPVSRSVTREPVSSVAKAPKAPKARVEASSASSGGLFGVAASLAGISYVYGGTSTAGFDCSGFTQYVFRKVGISLPRTAEAQRQAATTVANPRPGDLVFVGSPANHVGIYAGNGMMWDSPRTGKAVSKRSIWSTSATFGRV